MQKFFSHASIFLSTVTIVLSTIFSYINIKKTNKSLDNANENTKLTAKNLELSTKADIVFYMSKCNQIPGTLNLNIKNFGKSSGKLLFLELNPPLSYKKSNFPLPPCEKDKPLFTDSKNIFLAPNEKVTSWFPLYPDYPDKVFDIFLSYESLGKIYNISYKIDLNYRNSLFSISNKSRL